MNNDRTTSEQQVNNEWTHYKNIKNIKKDKNNIIESEIKISPQTKKNDIESEKQSFIEKLKPFSKKNGGEFEPELLKEFFHYWTELNTNEKKMRYQSQKFFEIKRRLITWKKNQNNGQTNKQATQPSLREFSNIRTTRLEDV